jgi:hypothetical protein
VFIHCSPSGPGAFSSGAGPHLSSPVSGCEGRNYDHAVTKFLAKIVAWITAGYPEGVPGSDRVPLFALLQRRLSDDEVKAVAKDLMDRGEFDKVDIGVLITEMTDELPTPDDIERVRERLAAKGWPLDDPRDTEETE